VNAVAQDMRPEGTHGGKRAKGQGANSTLKRGSTSVASTVARLKRDRPDLAAKVVAGKMSANAAAVAAGFRVPSITVPLERVKAAAGQLQIVSQKVPMAPLSEVAMPLLTRCGAWSDDPSEPGMRPVH
jgi:hypothetical protein